jgi:3-oxoacyl-[acyl-carrier protein] reductase
MDATSFRGKVALVTGASRGIGASIARSLAARGARVALTARSADRLAAVAREIGGAAASGMPVVVSADLADPREPERIVAEVVAALGRLDILVANAGTAARAPLRETTTEQWDRLMAVNARAPFLLCRAAIPHLAKSGDGRIVIITSVVATQGYANQAAYSASKHAAMGFAKAMAREVHPLGIRVHVVAPGGVDTDLGTSMRPDLDPSGLISPAEVAETVAFLLEQGGNAVIDEINIRRTGKVPWS